jgi:acetyl-CoA carboxylase carboxyltransferase component
MTRAGTLDIEASRKAARFVAACDAFNLPIVTFVDTPGFEPGRDLEWRGMIRHGAELVHAYSAATVPRLCVVLRKAYGGAYIVMDSRGIGNDLCVAWPSAEIAVMGAAGAVAILNKGRTDPELVAEYRDAFENPYRAAERGFVDAVIEPASTRRVLVDTLEMLADKRDSQPARRHSNTPL